MANYNYKLIDGTYHEIGDEEIDEIQNEETKKTNTTNGFLSSVLPSKNQYVYKSGTNSYDVTNLIKKEYEKETQSLNEKYGGDLAVINTSFDDSKNTLDSAREKELQNEYINKEKKLDILPSNLLQTGLDGGATETANMQIESDYQGARSDIEEFFMNELNKLIKERDEELRKEQEAYQKQMEAAQSSYQNQVEKAVSSSSSKDSYELKPDFSLNIKNKNEEEEKKNINLPSIFNGFNGITE